MDAERAEADKIVKDPMQCTSRTASECSARSFGQRDKSFRSVCSRSRSIRSKARGGSKPAVMDSPNEKEALLPIASTKPQSRKQHRTPLYRPENQSPSLRAACIVVWLVFFAKLCIGLLALSGLHHYVRHRLPTDPAHRAIALMKRHPLIE